METHRVKPIGQADTGRKQLTQSDSADLKVFSTCQSTGLVEELVVFILDFGTRPVKRKTLQAEKRREDAAELSEVALQSSGLWQAPTEGI